MLPLIPARKGKTVVLQWSVTGHTNNALGQALCQGEVGQYKTNSVSLYMLCFVFVFLSYLFLS